MDIFLIRHGMTPGNREHRYIGRTDEPLSEEGRAALLPPAWADQVESVCVSPMLRARQTACGLQLLGCRDGVEGFFIARMRRVR